ncbi:MAG: hypothetical protein KatS3mg101_1026 [Patescibacteria group bacterium]|nr:MAG: hypothetical protein KatS3mg101_1026 [Patescibacteria group bacterium]
MKNFLDKTSTKMKTIVIKNEMANLIKQNMQVR